jgi:hypothetical protein
VKALIWLMCLAYREYDVVYRIALYSLPLGLEAKRVGLISTVNPLMES